MPKHSEKRTLPYSSEQVFDLVADVEAYPQFLPWCRSARIISRDDKGIVADLVIGYKIFTERFRSEVALDRPRSITVHYLSGPLSRLSNRWEFRPKGKSACELCFDVDFDFTSSLLGAAMELFFDKAILKMVGAFEERAKELFGEKA
jgi:coenzyme Q-binding protein COQ10